MWQVQSRTSATVTSDLCKPTWVQTWQLTTYKCKPKRNFGAKSEASCGMQPFCSAAAAVRYEKHSFFSTLRCFFSPLGHWGQATLRTATLRTRLWGRATLRTGDFEDMRLWGQKFWTWQTLAKLSEIFQKLVKNVQKCTFPNPAPEGRPETLQNYINSQMLAAYIQ